MKRTSPSQTQPKTSLRKTFYLIDLIIISIISLFGILQLGYWLYPSRWMIYFFLFQRANVTFLLYRKEKNALWPIIALLLLFIPFAFFFEDAFTTAPGGFLAYSMTPDYDYLYYVFPFLSVLLVWLWLMPIVCYGVLHFTKRIENHHPSWQQLAGLTIVISRTGRCFLGLFTVVFLAFVSGVTLQLFTSHYALLILPTAAYYLTNKYLKRKPAWWEYGLLIAGMWVFDLAKTQTDFLRVFGLVLSAIFVFSLCALLFIKTKQLLATLGIFLALAFLLPSMTIGYNIYTVTDAVTLRNYDITESGGRAEPLNIMFTFRYDKEKERYYYGMRDRYRELIPCQYRSIVPADGHEYGYQYVICRTDQGTIIDNIYSIYKDNKAAKAKGKHLP